MPLVSGKPGLHGEFKASLSSTVRLSLSKKLKTVDLLKLYINRVYPAF